MSFLVLASSAGWLSTWRLLLDRAALPIGDMLAQSPNGWHPGGAVSIAAQVRACTVSFLVLASSAGWLFTWRLLLDGAPLPMGHAGAEPERLAPWWCFQHRCPGMPHISRTSHC